MFILFLSLTNTTQTSIKANKGKIANHENSGTAGVRVGTENGSVVGVGVKDGNGSPFDVKYTVFETTIGYW